jgi:putative ABC transport system ATP-binding protein
MATAATDFHHPAPRPFSRVWDLLHPDRRDVVAVALYAVVVAVLSLGTPIAVESLVNTVAFGVLMWPVIVIAGILMLCLGLAAAIRGTQKLVVEYIQRRVFVRVVADYAERIPRCRLDAFDRHFAPELGNRYFDLFLFQKAFAFLVLDGIALFVTGLVGLTVLAFYHPFLLAFDIVLIALIVFLLTVLGWGGVRTSLKESSAKYEVAAWLEELFRNLRGFKLAGGQALAVAKADDLTAQYIAARAKHFSIVWRQTVFALGLQVVASTALLGLGGYLVIERQLTLGQLVAAELIVSLVMASVAKLGKYAETYYDLMSSAEKLGVIVDLPLEREGGETLPSGDRGVAVRIRGLGSHPNHSALGQVDWSIEVGERVAVIGPPASGKSTFFEVLCGLRTSMHYAVEMDGIDLRVIDLEQYRKSVALVDHSDLFNGTVLENLRVGRVHLSATEIRDALHAVGLDGVVAALPEGLNERVVPFGKPLSRSQAIRLTIARALVGRPRLLILDGVLDALDPHDCPELLATLFDRSAPWTLIVASARPDIIARCDRTLDLSLDPVEE